VATFDAIPGNPVVVADHAARYLATANAINDAAVQLIGVANQDDSIGDAFVAMRDLAYEVSKDIGKAESRYRVTATALATYAGELEAAQTTVRNATDAAGDAQSDVAAWQTKIDDYQDLIDAGGPDVAATTQLQNVAKLQLSSAQSSMSGARTAYDTALADLEDAAKRAADLIDDVTHDSPLNDSLLDNVGGVLSAIGDWFASTFGPFLEALVDGIRRLFVVLVLALVLTLALGLLLALLLPLGMALMVAGVLVVTLLAAWIIYCLVQESRDPVSTGSTTSGKVTDPTHDPNADDTMSTFLDDQHSVDKLSGENGNATIRVTKVYDEDGNVIAVRVQMPSTQDWDPVGGSGLSDLEANVVGFISPEQQTALEKATIDAIRQAMADPDVPPGTPIALGGFSQSGKVATELASRPQVLSEFNIREVFVVGAADIDPDIPPQVHVTSLSHDDDPLRIVMKPAIGLPSYPSNYTIQNGQTGGHDAIKYGETGDASTDPGMAAARDRLKPYTSATESYTDYTYVRG